MIAPTIRFAYEGERAAVEAVLTTCDLGIMGVMDRDTNTTYLVAVAEDQIIGVVGLEYGADDACLLRSLAVLPPYRCFGIGAILTQVASQTALHRGMRWVYLFSTGAGPYYERLGFVNVPVSELVGMLPDAPQVVRFDRIGQLPTEVAYRLSLEPQERHFTLGEVIVSR